MRNANMGDLLAISIFLDAGIHVVRLLKKGGEWDVRWRLPELKEKCLLCIYDIVTWCREAEPG